jgi:hypothetical protein
MPARAVGDSRGSLEPANGYDPAMVRTSLRCAAPALLVAALVLVPHFDKAYTIDDPLFLKQAEQLLSDPLHPTAFEVVWSESFEPQRMSAIMPSGPAMAYLLVPCALAGAPEWLAHLTGLAVFALALLATAALALRLGTSESSARAAALLLAATPAALALASTAMPDVPAMAFGVLGIERLLAFRDGRGWSQALAASVALAFAALSRSHLLLLLPVGALLLVGGPLATQRLRELGWRPWLPLVAAPALFVAFAWLTRDPLAPNTALLESAQRYMDSSQLVRNVTGFAAHWTLALPLALPWAALRWRALVRQPFLYVAALVWGVLLVQSEPRPDALLGVAAAVLSAGVLWDVIADALRRRDAVQLALGAWLLIALPIAVYTHLPSKYLVASAPAAAILVARALESQSRTFARALLGATLVAGVVLGMLVIRADAAFAELGRRAAAELIAPNVRAGRTVWFDGHWGFQWYAERAGARPLTSTPPHPKSGDLILSGKRSMGQKLEYFPQRVLRGVLEDTAPGGRVMSKRLGAGFYSTRWGLLPWAFGDDLRDRFELWQLD